MSTAEKAMATTVVCGLMVYRRAVLVRYWAADVRTRRGGRRDATNPPAYK